VTRKLNSRSTIFSELPLNPIYSVPTGLHTGNIIDDDAFSEWMSRHGPGIVDTWGHWVTGRAVCSLSTVRPVARNTPCECRVASFFNPL
jgi:hypothetical protein